MEIAAVHIPVCAVQGVVQQELSHRKGQGKNTFIDEVINATKDIQIWHFPNRDVPIRSAGRMNLPDPLILEYELKDWMNPNYTGSNATLLATTAPNDKYRGLTRRDDSLDDFGFTENTDS